MKRFFQSIKGTPFGLTRKQIAVNFAVLAAFMAVTVAVEAAIR